MAGQLDEAAKQILGTLLADFTDRGLTAQDLKMVMKARTSMR